MSCVDGEVGKAEEIFISMSEALMDFVKSREAKRKIGNESKDGKMEWLVRRPKKWPGAHT